MAKKREFRLMPDTSRRGGGIVRFIASGEGYAMIRRPCCMPFIVDEADWLSWPVCNSIGEIADSGNSINAHLAAQVLGDGK